MRNDSPLGVNVFDVDDFKAINDTLGHLAGDRVFINIVRSANRMLSESFSLFDKRERNLALDQSR